MESTETVSSTAAIDDLVGDQMGEPSPEPQVAAEPTQESVSEPQSSPQQVGLGEPGVSSGEASVEAVSAPETASQPTPVAQTYKIGDRDYTVQEIQAAFTSAQQLPHLQQKYTQMLEQYRQQPQSQVQSQQAQPQGSMEQWLQQVQMKYQPEIKSLTDKGLISKDFATLFPAELSQMLAYRDGYQQLAQKVQQIEGFTQQQTQAQQTNGLMQDMSRNIQTLASSHNAFAGLKDPNEVTGFVNHLWNLNPQVGQLRNPEFLAGQYAAYKKDVWLTNAQAQAVNQARNTQQRLARADATTGSRPPGGFQEPVKTPLDQMVDDFINRANS